jgi:glycosyltransferase involved in cell wall biosynthesis
LVSHRSSKPEAQAAAAPGQAPVASFGRETGYEGLQKSMLEAPTGVVLVVLDESLEVEEGWLDVLIETFHHRQDCGLVAGRVVLDRRRQLDVGAVVSESGTLRRIGFESDRTRPEFNYLRPIDCCIDSPFAISAEVFRGLGGFDIGLSSMPEMVIDLCVRARREGYGVYCQALAAALQTQPPSAFYPSGRPSSAEPAVSNTLTRRLLSYRRAVPMAPRRLEDTDRQQASKLTAFVVDYALPKPDRDSGSLRMFNMLAILQEAGFDITFGSMGLEDTQPYLSELQRRGIQCLYRPSVMSLEQHLRIDCRNRYDLVILSRMLTADELLPAVRRTQPNAVVVFDTVDLHHRRLETESAMRKHVPMARRASRVRKAELRLVDEADVTFVVSDTERAYLATTNPLATVRVVSNIHRVMGSQTPYSQRRHLLFVGGFGHPPNVDAVEFFCRAVFPLVSARLPDVKIYIVGSQPTASVARLSSENVFILGYVPDIEPLLHRCRASVAPLRFGAGVKGKVHLSMSYGLPVVMTSLAADGMFVKHGESALIADDPQSFSNEVVRVYQDELLWTRLSENGARIVEEHFSFSQAARALSEVAQLVRRSRH